MADTAVQSAAAEIEQWLSRFDQALTAGDSAAAAELFADDSFWRDLVSFTWNIKTVEGRAGVRDMLDHTLERTRPRNWRAVEPPAAADGVTEAWIEFETEVGRGHGHLRLKDGRAWTLLTTLAELKGHEESAGPGRPKGVEHGADPDRVTWLEQREREAAELGYETQPYVVIVGGGQGGIALGARLRQLRVPTIIVERNERPGDSWRKRYKSLCLHDPVWYDHLPYIKFPESWPVFSPKDKIGDWLEMYTRVMELNYWSSTTAKSARYDEEAGEWLVVVERDGADITLRPKQLVMATGMSGKPNVPEIPGMDVFKGDQHHSSQHLGPDAYRGQKAVVIGSNNSAHDICAALWEVGADVTMVQRSSTHIVRSDTLMDIGLSALYSEQAVQAGVTTEKADMIFASLPYRILHEFQIPLYDQMRERDADFYDRLEKAGFQLDWGEDGSGLFMKYLRRGSGYYIDVGASELVANGDIKLAPGTVGHLTEDAVVMTDGTELPADLVVYATGYGSMNGWVADLISQDVADQVGKVWGLGSGTAKDPGPWEGEERNIWKPTQQEALWFHGGNLHQSRYYSLYLALQLKARAEGIDT
ncbi:MAG: putative flavoprotein involved in transport, partial [Solirubrobacteraceae bacterium]|nr:putative flavoprotein involved in transport [Solirubrobacteraceae bacterium]